MITQISDFNVMVTINKDNASTKAISPIMELAGKSFYPGRLVKSGGHRYMEVVPEPPTDQSVPLILMLYRRLL